MIRAIPSPAKLRTLRRRVTAARVALYNAKTPAARIRLDLRLTRAIDALDRAEHAVLSPFNALSILL